MAPHGIIPTDNFQIVPVHPLSRCYSPFGKILNQFMWWKKNMCDQSIHHFCLTAHISKYWRKEMFENLDFKRSDNPPCLSQPIGPWGIMTYVFFGKLQSRFSDIFIFLKVFLFWKCHFPTDFLCENIVLAQPLHTTSLLCDWTLYSEPHSSAFWHSRDP